ncbi:hypothetical protein P0136_01575 [Lentisphaerota bacterium ZTH]|nr:hypothetical protein JYG24_07285 [Lentisphaerota bacterium]WET06704.1 hypothetical protein P0136_01575 [Lentisphaerota bacterium ZTH]
MAEKSILEKLSGDILKNFAVSIRKLLRRAEEAEYKTAPVSRSGLEVLCGIKSAGSIAAHSGRANIGIDSNSSILNEFRTTAVRGKQYSGYWSGVENPAAVNQLYYRGGTGNYTATWLTEREAAKSSPLQAGQNEIAPESIDKAVNALIRQEDMISGIKTGIERISDLLSSSGGGVSLS